MAEPAENKVDWKGYNISAIHPMPAPEPMRDDYLKSAQKVIDDPMILINVISRRVKQLRRGSRPLVESLEKLSAEDTALREVAEGKITYALATTEELLRQHNRTI